MNSSELLSASVLDIIFENRNKTYGAYVLRRLYNRHLIIALVCSVTGLSAFLTLSYPNAHSKTVEVVYVSDSVILKPPPAIETPPAPPPQAQVTPAATISTANSLVPTVPLIVNEDVEESLEVPLAEEIVEAPEHGSGDGVKYIGEAEKAGAGKSTTVVTPPTAAPTQPEIYTVVDEAGGYPGGTEAWKRFLERTLNYPDAAIDHDVQGKVQLSFVIDTLGKLSDIIVLSDPGSGLGDEAVRIMQKSKPWMPAKVQGRKVKYRHTQTINFRLEQ